MVQPGIRCHEHLELTISRGELNRNVKDGVFNYCRRQIPNCEDISGVGRDNPSSTCINDGFGSLYFTAHRQQAR